MDVDPFWAISPTNESDLEFCNLDADAAVGDDVWSVVAILLLLQAVQLRVDSKMLLLSIAVVVVSAVVRMRSERERRNNGDGCGIRVGGGDDGGGGDADTIVLLGCSVAAAALSIVVNDDDIVLGGFYLVHSRAIFVRCKIKRGVKNNVFFYCANFCYAIKCSVCL